MSDDDFIRFLREHAVYIHQNGLLSSARKLDLAAARIEALTQTTADLAESVKFWQRAHEELAALVANGPPKPAMLCQEYTGRWHAFESAIDPRIHATPVNVGCWYKCSVDTWIWYPAPKPKETPK